MSGDDAIAPMQKTERKKREEKERHEVSLTQQRKAERSIRIREGKAQTFYVSFYVPYKIA